MDILLAEAFRHVDDERSILHQPAVLTLGGLVGAQATPLRGVQVTGLEVGLGPRQRGGDPPQMGQRAHVGGAVQQLGDAGAPSHPIAGGERVQQAVGEQVGPDGGADAQVLLPGEAPLQLVLEVLHEVGEGHPEQVLHEVAGQLEALVGVVVLVILLPHPDAELEDVAGDPAQEVGLLDAVLLGVAQVGQQRAVDDRLDLLLPVLLGLSGGELALQEGDGIFGGEYAVWRVQLLVVTLLDVGVHDVGHLRNAHDGVVDVLVVLHVQRLHQGHQGDLTGGGGDGDHEDAVLLLLHQGEGAVALPLREYLGHFELGAVALVELDHDPVGGEVLQGDEHPLGPADDEVSAGVGGVLRSFHELPAVLLIGQLTLLLHVLPVEVAALGAEHDRKVSQVDLLRLLLDAVLYDGEVQLDGGHVVDVPKPRLHRRQVVSGPVGLPDHGGPDADGGAGLGVDHARLLIPPAADADLDYAPVGAVGVQADDAPLSVVSSDAEVVHDLLHPAVGVVQCGEEIVVAGNVMVYDAALLEI